MDILTAIVILVISYLIGSLSFGRILMRILKPGEDLEDVAISVEGWEEPRKLMSVGGNTASIKLGSRWGCAVAWLDILKAFIPTLAVRLLYPGEPYIFVAAIGALCGHNWPIYHRFKGGRGISPFYGGLFAIDSIGAIVVAVSSLLIGMLVFKQMLIAYAGGVILLLPWFLVTKYNDPLFVYYIIYVLLAIILFVVSMIPEVKQSQEMRKKYGDVDMMKAMDAFPMGREMKKLMKRLGLRKESEENQVVKE